MLRLQEYPKGTFSLYDADTNQYIDGLMLADLELIKLMVEGVITAKMPEPPSYGADKLFNSIMQDHINKTSKLAKQYQKGEL